MTVSTWGEAAEAALNELQLADEFTVARTLLNDDSDRGLFKTIGYLICQQWTFAGHVEHLCSKQRDYGHDNITAFGVLGIKVRLSDKLARYANLTKNGIDPENESLEDTVKDIIGYCVVGLMLCDGTFLLQLEAEEPF